MPEYSGRVDSLIFRNDDNGYSVLVIKPEHGKAFTCFGTLPFAEEGDLVKLEGEWTHHPDYGEQLKVSRFSFDMPATSAAIVRYLSSGGIKGIGEDTARRIVEHFGIDTLKIMYEHPERLTEVKGIGKVKAAPGYMFNDPVDLFVNGEELSPEVVEDYSLESDSFTFYYDLKIA